jgi:acyl dehydratase
MAHDIRVLGNRFVYAWGGNMTTAEVHLPGAWLAHGALTSAGLQKFFFLVHGRHMGLHGTYYNRMAVLLGMFPETESTA